MAKKKKKNQTKMTRNQKIMVIIGIFIVIAMLLPSLAYLFQ